MNHPTSDIHLILEVLTEHEVDFIIIGGVCATLHGSSLMTLDIDLVHSREGANLEKLAIALGKLEARYREHEPKQIVPTKELLASEGHHLLMTRGGPLDLIGTVTKKRDYKELLEHTLLLAVGDQFKVRILDLPMLILLKEETGYEKDKAALPHLRRLLKEKENGK
jgi:predicted nucleotidyltransferase